MTPAPAEPRSSVVPVEVLDERRAGRSLVRVLRVRDDPGELAGHFPGLPVVPAVVELHWVMEAAARLAGGSPTLRRLEAVKFKDIVRPGQRVEIAVELCPTGDAVRFRVGAGERLFASGRCLLAPKASTA